MGIVECGQVYQVKGFLYLIEELFGLMQDVMVFEGGCFVMLWLILVMYYCFYVLVDGMVEYVIYFSGDIWNVNLVVFKCVECLFCCNECVVLCMILVIGEFIVLVLVVVILVVSICLYFLDVLLYLG